jgi:GT2 family glycosyltransferase
MPPSLSIMIATRNRVGELVKTLESCLALPWRPLEILVADDASTDGTSEVVRARFPSVRLIRPGRNVGSVAARNLIVREARGDYVLGLDDDSRLTDPGDCARLVDRMEREPDLGVLALQPVGPEHPERLTEAGRLRGEWHASSFAACGVLIRRAVFDRTGLFPGYFFHAYEEPDLCLRVWDAGYRVLQWNEATVYHEFSGLNRNEQRTHRRHARNEACSVWMRYPWHLVLPATAARLAGQFRYARSRGWARGEPRVWAEFARYLPRALANRRPVGSRAVKICLALNRLRVADAREAWALGDLTWREVLALHRRADAAPAG